MTKRYDIAIVGSGPAGLSAAINAKVRNKEIIIFGSEELSSKLYIAHGINNYLGMYGKTGQEVVNAFKEHIKAMDIKITYEKITNILYMEDYFSMLTQNGMYESKTVILASGINFGKPFKGEKEFLGKGVSYCATCDAMFYREKTVAVIGFSKSEEKEANFLSEVVKKVYYIPMYKEDIAVNENVEIINDFVVEIFGSEQVEKLILKNKELIVDGVFVLRENADVEQLIPGLEINDGHVVVNRMMETSMKGCFAAGDIVGKPYQYIKAAGEGNIAALSAVEYLDKKKN